MIRIIRSLEKNIFDDIDNILFFIQNKNCLLEFSSNDLMRQLWHALKLHHNRKSTTINEISFTFDIMSTRMLVE